MGPFSQELSEARACTPFRVYFRLKIHVSECVTWPHTCSLPWVARRAPVKRTSRRSSAAWTLMLTQTASRRGSVSSVARTSRRSSLQAVKSLPLYPLVVPWLLLLPLVVAVLLRLLRRRRKRRRNLNQRRSLLMTWALVSLTKPFTSSLFNQHLSLKFLKQFLMSPMEASLCVHVARLA